MTPVTIPCEVVEIRPKSIVIKSDDREFEVPTAWIIEYRGYDYSITEVTLDEQHAIQLGIESFS